MKIPVIGALVFLGTLKSLGIKSASNLPLDDVIKWVDNMKSSKKLRSKS